MALPASFVYTFRLRYALSLTAMLSSALVACEERQSFGDSSSSLDDTSETDDEMIRDAGSDDSTQSPVDEQPGPTTDDTEGDGPDTDEPVTDESAPETDEPAADETPADEALTDEAATDEDEAATDDLSMDTDESTADEAAVDEAAVDESTSDESATDESAVDDSTVPDSQLCTLDESSFGDGCVLAP